MFPRLYLSFVSLHVSIPIYTLWEITELYCYNLVFATRNTASNVQICWVKRSMFLLSKEKIQVSCFNNMEPFVHFFPFSLGPKRWNSSSPYRAPSLLRTEPQTMKIFTSCVAQNKSAFLCASVSLPVKWFSDPVMSEQTFRCCGKRNLHLDLLKRKHNAVAKGLGYGGGQTGLWILALVNCLLMILGKSLSYSELERPSLLSGLKSTTFIIGYLWGLICLITVCWAPAMC